jgi:GDPmannose 4,6-dehydratase
MYMDTALIFGVNSQDGYYLSQLCKKNHIDCIGVARSAGNWLIGDVGDKAFVETLIKHYQPAYIFHLAANSTTRHDALFENHQTISTGTLHILEAVKTWSLTSKVFITGSGLQFKNYGTPIKETDEFEASSPYSVARIQSVYAARYYRDLGIKTYVGYLFHHESPLRKSQHISRKIVDTVNRIAKGSNEVLKIGDSSVCKEWTFAGDVSSGIFDLIRQEEYFEATIGSGITYSIENWLNACFQLVGLNWEQHTELIDSYKPDYKVLVSDPTTMNKIGWNPTISFNELAIIMMQSPNGQTIEFK